MGRPIKKSRFGNSAGDFEVTGAFATGTATQPDGTGAEAVSTATGNYHRVTERKQSVLVNFTSTG
jgi:hypothetical protein